jgi:hypothetical protein
MGLAMTSLHKVWGPLLGLSFIAAGSASAAHPPAYTFQPMSFHTSLHGVPEGERREGCVGKACGEATGIVVAEGTTKGLSTPVHITIREHKKHGDGKKDIATLARKLASRDEKGKQVRLVTGEAGGRPSLEQWVIDNPCDRVVVGRVLVAMPDKIVEVETRSTLEPGHETGDSPLSPMTQILKNIRVRRLGTASLDPAKDQVTARELAHELPSTCPKK